MTDKDERMKDAVAELRFASDGIVNMLAANLTPKESFMRDLAADLSYAASAIASQAARLEAAQRTIDTLIESIDALRQLNVNLTTPDSLESIIDAQAAEIKWLKGQTSVYDALKVQINSRDTLIASQAAEIAALKEREIMRLAGISTAAQGYFKDGESIHTDYDTVALRDVTALYRKYEALRAENAALREGLPVPPRNEYWAQGEYGHD